MRVHRASGLEVQIIPLRVVLCFLRAFDSLGPNSLKGIQKQMRGSLDFQ